MERQVYLIVFFFDEFMHNINLSDPVPELQNQIMLSSQILLVRLRVYFSEQCFSP